MARLALFWASNFLHPFTPIIKLRRARTPNSYYINLKEERHVHLGWLQGELNHGLIFIFG